MRLDLLEGVRTLQWSGLHPIARIRGITDTLNGKESLHGGDSRLDPSVA
jgi:hypothetical protein